MGSKVTVVTCADVCRWKCWFIVAALDFCTYIQELRYQIVIFFYDIICMFFFWVEGHNLITETL